MTSEDPLLVGGESGAGSGSHGAAATEVRDKDAAGKDGEGPGAGDAAGRKMVMFLEESSMLEFRCSNNVHNPSAFSFSLKPSAFSLQPSAFSLQPYP